MWPFNSNSSDAPVTSAEAGPSTASSSSSTGPVATEEQTTQRYEAILKDEIRYQDRQYPTVEELPKCMNLMDEFLSCYAIGPQLRSFYRIGEPRDCRWKWQDFKYCLALKSEDEEDRRKLWVKRRAEWWAARRAEGSSEDVWELRKTPLTNWPPLYDPNDTPETLSQGGAV